MILSCYEVFLVTLFLPLLLKCSVEIIMIFIDFLNVVYMFKIIMCLVNVISWILPSTGLQQRDLFEVSGRRTVFF